MQYTRKFFKSEFSKILVTLIFLLFSFINKSKNLQALKYKKPTSPKFTDRLQTTSRQGEESPKKKQNKNKNNNNYYQNNIEKGEKKIDDINRLSRDYLNTFDLIEKVRIGSMLRDAQ